MKQKLILFLTTFFTLNASNSMASYASQPRRGSRKPPPSEETNNKRAKITPETPASSRRGSRKPPPSEETNNKRAKITPETPASSRRGSRKPPPSEETNNKRAKITPETPASSRRGSRKPPPSKETNNKRAKITPEAPEEENLKEQHEAEKIRQDEIYVSSCVEEATTTSFREIIILNQETKWKDPIRLHPDPLLVVSSMVKKNSDSIIWTIQLVPKGKKAKGALGREKRITFPYKISNAFSVKETTSFELEGKSYSLAGMKLNKNNGTLIVGDNRETAEKLAKAIIISHRKKEQRKRAQKEKRKKAKEAKKQRQREMLSIEENNQSQAKPSQDSGEDSI